MNLSKIGDKQFFKKVIAIGLPIALQNLLVNSSTMIDTMMIGTLGELSVAAVGLASQYASLFFSAFFGFTSGGIMFFSQYWGAGDEKGIARAYGLVVSCMLLVGILFGGAAIFAPRFVLGIYTDKQNIIEIGVPYLRIMGISFPLQALSMAVSSLLRSTEKVKAPVLASVVSQAVNILLNWLLIFGHFGLPAMGAAGAAVGTVVGGVVNVVILYAYCMREGNSLVLRLSEQFRWSASFVRQYFVKSLPIISNEIFYGIGQLIINIVMGRQVEEGIAAMAVFRVVERLVFAFFGGFTNASAVIVGKQIGAGELSSGYRDAKRFAFLCPAVTLVVCLLILPVRAPLLGIFGLSGQSLEYGMHMLLIYVVTGTLRTCNYIINDTFRASGETLFGTVMEIGCMFLITVPVVWVAGIVLQLPFIAVFSLMFIDDFVRIFVMLRYLRSGRWIKPVTREGMAALAPFRQRMGIRKTGGMKTD